MPTHYEFSTTRYVVFTVDINIVITKHLSDNSIAEFFVILSFIDTLITHFLVF